MWNFSPTTTNTDNIFISKLCFCQIWQKSLISERAKFYRPLLVYSSSIFFSWNDFKYSNKFFSRSQYCSLLKETVASRESWVFVRNLDPLMKCDMIQVSASISAMIPAYVYHSLFPSLSISTPTPPTIHTESSSIIPTLLLFHKLFSVDTSCIYFIKYFHKNINLVYLRLHFLLGHTG